MKINPVMHERQPLSCGKIAYPLKPSEFDIQAELFGRLRTLGFDVRGEVGAYCSDHGKEHRTNLDLVVFNSKREPCVIIEVKDHPRPKENAFTVGRCLGSRQHRRYSSFGIPLWTCFTDSEIPRIVEKLLTEKAQWLGNDS